MSSMTVSDLIEKLEEMDPDSEVRIAHQPNYPFEYSIGSVIEDGETLCGECDAEPAMHEIKLDDGRWLPVCDLCHDGYAEDARPSEITGANSIARRPLSKTTEEDTRMTPPVVYIGEANQLDYLPASASRLLGWR